MGAKEAKQEQARPEEKTEEKAEHKKEESKPPTPFVLLVDLHCVGCAKKIEKSILKIRGVEGVVIDMSQNQVTIKGVIEPQAICTNIMKKTKRRAQVLSPTPAAEGEPIPEVVDSQVSGLTTVELNVNMHCEACAEQLKRKILKMRGVRSATTELSLGKVRVTGTIDANKLVDYVYRRTKKQAKIVPQPEPQPAKPPVAEAEAKPEEEKKEAEKPPEEPKPEEKKLEEVAQGENKPPPEEEKKEGGDQGNNGESSNNGKEENKEEPKKEEEEDEPNILTDEQTMQRMMYYYQPLYVIERIPPPQLFSDDNPNACCIT